MSLPPVKSDQGFLPILRCRLFVKRLLCFTWRPLGLKGNIQAVRPRSSSVSGPVPHLGPAPGRQHPPMRQELWYSSICAWYSSIFLLMFSTHCSKVSHMQSGLVMERFSLRLNSCERGLTESGQGRSLWDSGPGSWHPPPCPQDFLAFSPAVS